MEAQAAELNVPERCIRNERLFKKPPHRVDSSVGKDNAKRKRASQKVCSKCGRQHSHKHCTAFGKLCYSCNKMNHFAKCCISQTEKPQVHVGEKEFFVDMVESRKPNDRLDFASANFSRE